MNLEKTLSCPTQKLRVGSYAVRLRGLRLQSRVGVTDVEREQLQEVVVDVDMELGGNHYPCTDEISAAVDYAAIVRQVELSTSGSGDLLLETFALRVARRLEILWPVVAQIRVAATKAVVPTNLRVDAAIVEVTLGGV